MTSKDPPPWLLLLESGRQELDWLVTHRKLDDVDEAIGLLTGDANKVLLLPNLT